MNSEYPESWELKFEKLQDEVPRHRRRSFFLEEPPRGRKRRNRSRKQRKKSEI